LRTLALTAALTLPSLLVGAGQAPGTGAESARWVAEQIDHRDIGRDSSMSLAMRLFDRQGRVRERALTLTTLRGASGAGDRLLLRFQAPNDIKGTGFLVWENPKGEDERFLYLPALGRVRRIAGAEKQESFAGSDLAYENIGGRELDDYTYAFVQRDMSWTAPDGGTHRVWQLESRTVDRQARYPRTVSLVRKDNFVLVAADVYNRRDEREKRYEVRRLQQVDGIWTAMESVMVNDVQRTRTELSIASVRYNVGLSEQDFSRRMLERGAR
jgi:Outer membrane lipoprotein-sorting protein